MLEKFNTCLFDVSNSESRNRKKDNYILVVVVEEIQVDWTDKTRTDVKTNQDRRTNIEATIHCT